jgi:hypothetical protein
MKLHRKAKTTPASRLALVQRAIAGEAYGAIALGMGISERTVATSPPGAIALIRVLREQHALPAWAIARALRVPRSTVGAWLRRLGLNRRPSPAPIPVQRYFSHRGCVSRCVVRPSNSRWVRSGYLEVRFRKHG